MSRLKVLLFKPFSKSDELIPPFSLGYLAAAIRDRHNVEILDGLKDKMTPEKFRAFLSEKKYDLIGMQIFTFHLPIVREYIKIIKEVSPETRVVLGGAHPSCSPNDIFDYFPHLDWAFQGEAEVGFPKLLELIANGSLGAEALGKVPGLVWRGVQGIEVNPSVRIENLDELGMPSWDLIRPDRYPLAPHGGFFKNYPIAPIIITRGCPFACTYCAGPVIAGRKIRSRSAEGVIEEIKLLYHQYGIREIHIEDDNFTFNHDFVREFCQKLKENELDISWTCPNGVRLDTLTEDLLLTMKEAGLYFLSVGIESGSDRILKDMRKNLTKDQIREKIDLIKKCGLEVSGFFMIGYPTETKEDILETIDFAISLDLKRAAFSLFKPFPGVEITKDLIERGELKNFSDEDWARFILSDAVYAPPGLTLKEMKRLRLKALRRFYLRPKIVVGFLKDIRGFSHWLVVLKRIYSWLVKAK